MRKCVVNSNAASSKLASPRPNSASDAAAAAATKAAFMSNLLGTIAAANQQHQENSSHGGSMILSGSENSLDSTPASTASVPAIHDLSMASKEATLANS